MANSYDSSQYPTVGDVYRSKTRDTFVIDKVMADGWIFVRNTKTQARHRMRLDRLKKDYTYVSHS